jgi:Putative auto-transporter adhesin, head GIN domain
MNPAAVTVAALTALVIAAKGAWWVLTRAAGVDADSASTRRALTPFRQVVLEGNADIALVQGGAEAIAIEVPGRSIVHAEVRDQVLTIRAEDERRWWSFLLGTTHRPPRVTLTVRELDAVRASGAIRLNADTLRAEALTLRFSGAATLTVGALEARMLTVSGSGAFKADIAGRVDDQRITISGAGDYRAGNLVSERATISVSGAGRALVHAQKTLEVDLSGAAKVDYKGDPRITQRVSGAARIRRFESAVHRIRVALAD